MFAKQTVKGTFTVTLIGIAALMLCQVVKAESEGGSEENVWNTFKLGSTDDSSANLDERLIPVQAGPFVFGGFARFNLTDKDWDTNYDSKGEFEFDVVGVNVNLKNAGPWIGSFQYRFYEPTNGGDQFYHFMHHGWLGYQIDEDNSVKVGVNQVPFGVTPFASNNWFFQLPYYVGLEDDYDLGIKFKHVDGAWCQELAYYACDEGQYYGDSRDSARYSYDVVKTDSASNEERNQFNYRIAYTCEHNEDWTSEIGGSLEYSQIYNDETDENGNHYAAAVHVNSSFGDYNVKAEAIRYEYDLKNPDGVDGSYVVMGAYDAPYNVASRANIYCVGINRSFDVNWGPITNVTIYNDYSIMAKDADGFSDTQHNVTGFSMTAGRFVTYFDVLLGRNQPWASKRWTDSLAAGDGADTDWYTRVNLNVGYYF